MRKFIIAGNWKMNKTSAETMQLATALKAKTQNWNKVDIVICPTFPALLSAKQAIEGSNIQLGAQNMYWETSGAYTGEVSADMLINVGCQYVILGHSERRQYFGETNETINKKLKKALSTSLTPIVCVGELLKERQDGVTEKVLKEQIVESFQAVTADEMQRVVIAYEPVWAIGTGVTATPQQAQETQAYIRKVIGDLYNAEIANSLRIQYGGSMKPENAEELLQQPDIDGGLIGGASLKADSFARLIEIAEKLSA